MIAELYPHCQGLSADRLPRATDGDPHQNTLMEYQREHVAGLIRSHVKRMKDNGISRRRIASDIGVDEKTLRNLEAGVGAPRIDTIYKLCEQLNLSLLDFLGERDAMAQENEELRTVVRETVARISGIQSSLDRRHSTDEPEAGSG